MSLHATPFPNFTPSQRHTTLSTRPVPLKIESKPGIGLRTPTRRHGWITFKIHFKTAHDELDQANLVDEIVERLQSMCAEEENQRMEEMLVNAAMANTGGTQDATMI